MLLPCVTFWDEPGPLCNGSFSYSYVLSLTYNIHTVEPFQIRIVV